MVCPAIGHQSVQSLPRYASAPGSMLLRQAMPEPIVAATRRAFPRRGRRAYPLLRASWTRSRPGVRVVPLSGYCTDRMQVPKKRGAGAPLSSPAFAGGTWRSMAPSPVLLATPLSVHPRVCGEPTIKASVTLFLITYEAHVGGTPRPFPRSSGVQPDVRYRFRASLAAAFCPNWSLFSAESGPDEDSA